jgi:hypothetical protein
MSIVATIAALGTAIIVVVFSIWMIKELLVKH